MTLYQIAEITGNLRVDDIREELTPGELCEWGVYLNGPFSTRTRDMMMNGWLVQVIRSIMADKKNPPKFSDSVFPFSKLAQEFFVKAQPAPLVPDGSLKTVGEVMHLSRVISQRYDKWIADYRAGRVPGKDGLFIHERVRE